MVKGVSVYAGNKKSRVGTAGTNTDDLLEEFPPSATWGRKFVTVPYPGSAAAEVRQFMLGHIKLIRCFSFMEGP